MQNNLTDFVCAAAAANHSPLACDRCEFFTPPPLVHRWIDAMRDGTWPKRSWREQGGDACYVTTKAGNRILRGACKMKPIIDSPCRYLGRIEPGHCFLRTYTYLLAQHRALLEWGRSAGS